MAKNEQAETGPETGSETGSDTGLPPGLETAWGLRERAPRGPARGLDVPRIVEAAIGLADAEGLGAVSMSRVAKEVGVSTMALYRYVAAKDELLILMEDAAIGSPPQEASPQEAIPQEALPKEPRSADGWRAGLEFWAQGIRAVYERHPWLLRIPISTPPLSPHNIEWMELALSHLRDRGLGAEEQLGVLTLLGGYVRNQGMLEADIAAAAEEAGQSWSEVEQRYWTLLDRLTDRDRFPAITALLESGDLGGQNGVEAEEPGTTFEFGLERILDGIEVLMRQPDRPGGPGRR